MLRMRGAIPPFPQYVLMAWYLVKYRDNFNFYLYPDPKTAPTAPEVDINNEVFLYEGLSKSFRTGRLERELQMVQLCH
jgi:hypothetical protein